LHATSLKAGGNNPHNYSSTKLMSETQNGKSVLPPEADMRVNGSFA
jgi:hypothetical protein